MGGSPLHVCFSQITSCIKPYNWVLFAVLVAWETRSDGLALAKPPIVVETRGETEHKMPTFLAFLPDMNYVSAVYGVIIIIFTDWFARGRKGYRGQAARHEEIAVHLTQ